MYQNCKPAILRHDCEVSDVDKLLNHDDLLVEYIVCWRLRKPETHFLDGVPCGLAKQVHLLLALLPLQCVEVLEGESEPPVCPHQREVGLRSYVQCSVVRLREPSEQVHLGRDREGQPIQALRLD